jgi:hypothetical protein
MRAIALRGRSWEANRLREVLVQTLCRCSYARQSVALRLTAADPAAEDHRRE